MGYYYNKTRGVYEGRVTVYGRRVYLGSFKSLGAEQDAEAKYLNELASMERNYTLESYRMEYELQDSGTEWLKPFKAWMAERKKQKELRKIMKLKDLEVERLIEKNL